MDLDKPQADEYNLQKVVFFLVAFSLVALQAHAAVFLGTMVESWSDGSF